MLGAKERRQLEFFVCGSLRDLVPDDHILARVDRVLDLGWLREEVAELYATEAGRPGIDPEAALRLMLAGFLLGIVHDRRLVREAQVNLAIRWFAGYGLHERLPDHSSLTRIRQRWGPERFQRIFQRTVMACVAAGIAKGEVVHADASLIRADVAWESLAVRHVEAVSAANDGAPDQEEKLRRALEADRQVQEGLPHRSGRHHGDDRPQSSARAELQAAWRGRRRSRRRARRRGDYRRDQRGRGTAGTARRRRRDDRRRHPDRHRRRRLRLRQDLRRA